MWEPDGTKSRPAALAAKATALVLLILLGKLKIHAFRKREIYSKERFKDKENF